MHQKVSGSPVKPEVTSLPIPADLPSMEELNPFADVEDFTDAIHQLRDEIHPSQLQSISVLLSLCVFGTKIKTREECMRQLLQEYPITHELLRHYHNQPEALLWAASLLCQVNSNAVAKLASLHKKEGAFERALKLFQHALKRQPLNKDRNPEDALRARNITLFEIAHCFTRLGILHDSDRALSLIVSDGEAAVPQYKIDTLRVSNALLRGDFVRAEQLARCIVSERPYDLPALTTIANVLLRKVSDREALEESIEFTKLVLLSEPQNRVALGLTAKAYKLLGDCRTAIDMLERLQQTQWTYSDTVLYVSLLLQSGDESIVKLRALEKRYNKRTWTQCLSDARSLDQNMREPPVDT